MTTAMADPGASTHAVRRGPGRPRNEEIDSQLLRATLELIDEQTEVTAARIVERSGVSRAALYRRWPSLTTLISAALDVGREMPPAIPLDGNLREAILEGMLGSTESGPAEYPEERFRQRIRLVMADRELQKAYWSSHVSRRRGPMEAALRTGIEQGVLRPDLDVEACFDLIAGVFYYQIVVRGDRINDKNTHARCRAALEVTWRGMSATG
ncbi:TetR/AcrR family transcriptional regulator [Arthrobacter crystallopoietes]|uniref:TetR/AcrR family transcriptional regulator n=1 Tax=Crystallibacter crystallopoietes TaxID=37928 RepID=UPI003D20445C